MFNFFFRPYVPGFRVGLDGVPGFNIDDNGLPRRSSTPSDGMLPGSAAQQYPDAVQTQGPPGISFSLPGAEGWVLSTPLIGSSEYPVGSQDDIPGFNVRPQDGVPGFNIDENGIQQQETTWSEPLRPGSVEPRGLNLPQTPTPLPSEEEPAAPPSPPLPEWLYKPVTMLPPRLPIAFDPHTEWPIATNPQTVVGPAAVSNAGQWRSSGAPQQPADIAFPSHVAMTQDTSPQPAAQQAMRNTWLPPLKGGWPFNQGDGTPADPNFSLASAGDAGRGQQAQQQTPLQHYQQSQRTMPSAPPLAMAHLPMGPSTKMTPLERGPEQDPSQFIELYRRLKEAEARQPISERQSPPPSNENGAYASGSDGPSLGQRLVQSSVEALVPGAHYQELARQQLGAGNYVGAGVYQAAALVDAALGVATLGLSTRLGAAGRAAAAEGTAVFRRAFNSKKQLVSYLGPAPKDMQWHHIVEQSQAAQFGQRRIQSVENIVAIPNKEHTKLSAFYSSNQPISHPDRVRVWLRGQSFEEQYEYGMERLKRVLGY